MLTFDTSPRQDVSRGEAKSAEAAGAQEAPSPVQDLTHGGGWGGCPKEDTR